MKCYRILMTETAEDDLSKIAEYIAKELREPAIARKTIRKIKESVMNLAQMPIRHMTVADEYLAAQGIRMLSVENYIVFYVVSEMDGETTVIRILHGRRDWRQLL